MVLKGYRYVLVEDQQVSTKIFLKSNTSLEIYFLKGIDFFFILWYTYYMAKINKYSFSDLKDSMGRYRTQSLFWEFAFLNKERENVLEPLFTLKDYDLVKGEVTYPSLKTIYMTYDHVPGFEYEFALDVFGSWDHWNKLASETIPAIRNTIKEWREELEIKLKAQAIKSLIQTSRIDDVKGFNAAKYLADKGYAPTRGRPSKEEVEREKKVQAGVSKELEADMERLGLSVINGSK